MNTINYQALANAQQFYAMAGFKNIEVPWRVSEQILKVTRPPHVTRTDYKIEGTDKALIASGEQGFMYLLNKGFLPPGMYQTITPCFRNEQHDFTHSKQFMKLELIHVLEPGTKVTNNDVFIIGDLARRCMIHLSGGNVHFDARLSLSTVQNVEDPLLIDGTDQVDLHCTVGEGEIIELGSYGARSAQFGSWLYATGVAEPRFSKTLELVKSRIG